MALLSGLPVSVFGTPPPVEHFTRLPDIDGVVLSPSGNRLAILSFGKEGRRRLGVVDLVPSLGRPRIVAEFGNADVTSVRWVNDKRLVFDAFVPGAEVRAGEAGTSAVNHDASGHRQLISWDSGPREVSNITSRILPYGWYFHSTIEGDGDDIHVYKAAKDILGDLTEIQIGRLNTVTGELKSLSYGMPKGTRHWLLDRKSEPRVISAYVDGRYKVYWRKPESTEWTEVANFDALKEPGFAPVLVDREGAILVATGIGTDTEGLYQFDPVARQVLPEPLVKVAGFDLNPTMEVDRQTGNLVGVHFVADRPMSYWFDERLEKIQRGIDAALPGRMNRLFCGRCESTKFFAIHSRSDRHPGEYFLYDAGKASLLLLGVSRPWIDEASQGRRTFHRIAARDGLQFPVYVTHPANTAPSQALPAVVLVHGGPYVRGSNLGWNAEAQFLASRGYRVLQPEYRGSTGYGSRLFRAGWKQWGRAMQDDLVDAVQWAAKEGLVDPTKVCIVGASYGGYAALMAPITHPGVFRCAASFAGVTDIDLMYTVHWGDISEASRRYSMPVLIGDPEKDAAILATASPLKRASEIKIPVLLAHGGLDRRVPIVHASKFFNAARAGGVAIEKVDYPTEGHGFFLPANQADYFGRLERFLEKSLESRWLCHLTQPPRGADDVCRRPGGALKTTPN